MEAPTGALVREWASNNVDSSFDFDRYGYPEPAVGDPDQLDRVVARVVAWVESMTARKLDASLVDVGLVALAEDAVLMRLEQTLVGRGTTKAVRDALSNATIKQLRAGDYSHTARDPVDSRKGGQVTPWGDLSETLLALATPERRAELLAELNGTVRPLGLVVGSGVGPLGSSYYGE